MNENDATTPQQRQSLGKQVTPDELRALNLLILKKEVATQNAQNSSFPPGTSPQTQSAFYKASMELFSEAKFAEDEWWKANLHKYGLIGTQAYIDVGSGEFYTLVDAMVPPPPPSDQVVE